MILTETITLSGFPHRCLALTAACATNCRVRISFVAAGAELQEFRRGKEQEQRQQLSQESEATAAAARRESSPRVTLWLLRRRRAGQEDRRHRGQSGFGHGKVCWKPRLEVYYRFYRIHSYHVVGFCCLFSKANLFILGKMVRLFS